MKNKPAEKSKTTKESQFVGFKVPRELWERLQEEYRAELALRKYEIYSWADFIRDRLASTLAKGVK